MIRRWVEEAIASGEIIDLPANALASVLLGLNDGLMLHRAVDDGGFRWAEHQPGPRRPPNGNRDAVRRGIPLAAAGVGTLRNRLRHGPGPSLARLGAAWLRGSRLGLVVIALVVGAGAGLGAAGFRWLIFAFTWLATGHDQFGQQGRVASLHLAWLGPYFVLVVPVIGGLLYGPLLQRFAPEARGHGVPEVMVAVAENGGRIRPPVALVKALASALCIGSGGSVGREGPIVQIGSALASSLGQAVRVSETRLRIIVACGAAGGIAATFNAPITGLFFGFEIILREFSLDALVATSLAAVSADLVSRAFFGSAPFFSGIPHDLVITHDYTYLLVALLGLASGLVGYGFKTFLYKLEDVADRLWKGRPEWARPAVGGIALGALLLALPEMYGVGYPSWTRFAGHIVLWLLLVLVVGKVLAASLTLSIGVREGSSPRRCSPGPRACPSSSITGSVRPKLPVTDDAGGRRQRCLCGCAEDRAHAHHREHRRGLRRRARRGARRSPRRPSPPLPR